MALYIQTRYSLQWRLEELEKIIDSMEDEIEEAITHQNLQQITTIRTLSCAQLENPLLV